MQGGSSNGGGVDIRVTTGGDTSTKGRAKKGPKNNKKVAGELYTIN